MGDRKITLLELHFDRGFQIGPKTIGVGSDGEADPEELEEEPPEEGEESEDESTPGPGGAGKALLALVALAGIAILVRRILGGDDEDSFEEDEQAEIEEFEPAD